MDKPVPPKLPVKRTTKGIMTPLSIHFGTEFLKDTQDCLTWLKFINTQFEEIKKNPDSYRFSSHPLSHVLWFQKIEIVPLTPQEQNAEDNRYYEAMNKYREECKAYHQRAERFKAFLNGILTEVEEQCKKLPV